MPLSAPAILRLLSKQVREKRRVSNEIKDFQGDWRAHLSSSLDS